jgi:hypothetical protein
MSYEEYGDLVEYLPTDKTQLSHEELKIVNNLFKQENKNMLNIISYELRESIIGAIIFFCISLPFLDNYIKKYVPITNTSIYYLLIAKMILFVIIFWITMNFALSKSNN